MGSALKENPDELQKATYFFDDLLTEDREYELLNNLPDDHDLVDTPFTWAARNVGRVSDRPKYRETAKDILDFVEICKGFLKIKS